MALLMRDEVLRREEAQGSMRRTKKWRLDTREKGDGGKCRVKR